jgi:hypothetical protein
MRTAAWVVGIGYKRDGATRKETVTVVSKCLTTDGSLRLMHVQFEDALALVDSPSSNTFVQWRAFNPHGLILCVGSLTGLRSGRDDH